MYEAVQHCKHCGAGLALEDLRQPNCKFCKTVFPHHAQAAQHAQVASQMMGQMLQQQAAVQDQWRGAFGIGPMPPGVSGGVPGGIPGGMMPGAPMNPMNPYGYPAGGYSAGAARANAMSKIVIWLVVGGMSAAFAVVGVAVALKFVF